MSGLIRKCVWSVIFFASVSSVSSHAWPIGEVSGERRLSTLAMTRAAICALNTNRTVQCVGFNEYGVLGNGSTPYVPGVSGSSSSGSSTPVTVSGISNAISIHAAYGTVCALLSNGLVKCWGSNSQSLLGTAATGAYSTTPVVINGLFGVKDLKCVFSTCCAILSDGGGRCWGANSNGELGNGTTGGFSATPVAVSIANPIHQIMPGTATLASGAAFSWGSNSYGQVGDGTTTPRSTPVPINGSDAIVDFGGYFLSKCVLGLASPNASRVSCMGDNSYNQLGDGSGIPQSLPVDNTLLTFVPKQMAIQRSSNCALKSNGKVYCWGANFAGQLGDGTMTNQTTNAVEVLGVSDAVEITSNEQSAASSYSRACARLADGSIKCWGINLVSTITPAVTFVTLGSTPVSPGFSSGLADTAVSGGDGHSCGVRPNGQVRCWGSNGSGQLGDGTTTSRSTPTTIPGLSGVVSVSVKGTHSCAVMGNGEVRCWGNNAYGQLGDGSTTNRLSPVPVVGISDAISVSAGRYHTCAVLSDGTPKCWGRNDYGQLGNASTSNSSLPVTVANGLKVTQISAGNLHTCSIGTQFIREWDDGAGAYNCWGRNNYGQLGDGTTIDRSAPVILGPSRPQPWDGAEGITTHGDTSCFVSDHGKVYCWGRNNYGQVGDGSTTTRTLPAQVSNLPDACGVSAGLEHACSVTCSGIVKCWGRNNYGQLGDTTTIDRSTPVVLVGTNNSRTVGTGAYHSMSHSFVSSSQLMETWGRNNTWQVGDGTTTNRTSGTPIGFN